jgi:hypothetical protein
MCCGRFPTTYQDYVEGGNAEQLESRAPHSRSTSRSRGAERICKQTFTDRITDALDKP